MVTERRTPKRRVEDDRPEMVWAALQTLDVGLRYIILRELATDLNQERVEPRSAQGRVRAAVLSLNDAADFLGRGSSRGHSLVGLPAPRVHRSAVRRRLRQAGNRRGFHLWRGAPTCVGLCKRPQRSGTNLQRLNGRIHNLRGQDT